MRYHNKLRQRGWLIFFRDGYVIANKCGIRHALRMPIDNGAWLERAEANPGNWEQFHLNTHQQIEIIALQRVCYCRQLPDGDCDFCTGVRRDEVLRETNNLVEPEAVFDATANWVPPTVAAAGR